MKGLPGNRLTSSLHRAPHTERPPRSRLGLRVRLLLGLPVEILLVFLLCRGNDLVPEGLLRDRRPHIGTDDPGEVRVLHGLMRKDKFGLLAVFRSDQTPDVKIGPVVRGKGLSSPKKGLGRGSPFIWRDPHPLSEELRMVHCPKSGVKEKAMAILLNVSLPVIRDHPFVSRVGPEPIKTILKFVPLLGDGNKFIKIQNFRRAGRSPSSGGIKNK